MRESLTCAETGGKKSKRLRKQRERDHARCNAQTTHVLLQHTVLLPYARYYRSSNYKVPVKYYSHSKQNLTCYSLSVLDKPNKRGLSIQLVLLPTLHTISLAPQIYACSDSTMPALAMHLLIQKQQMVSATYQTLLFSQLLLQCFLFNITTCISRWAYF